MIGVGFDDRNDAFDLFASLDDFARQQRADRGEEKYDVSALEKDFSLKEG